MSLVSLRNLIDPSVTRALLGDRRISATASVVLPDPLSPMIASVSPFPSSNDTLRTALTGPRRLKYWMERSCTERTLPRRARGLWPTGAPTPAPERAAGAPGAGADEVEPGPGFKRCAAAG